MVKYAWKQVARSFWSFMLVVVFAVIAGLSFLVGEQLKTQTESRLLRGVSGIDVVVGAKGSPLQLVLSSLFFLDNPTGNISISESQRWANHPLVSNSLPIAMGDSYLGHRLVGTNSDFTKFYKADLAKGAMFQKDFEVVLGNTVAQQRNLELGDNIITQHGSAEAGKGHHEHPYRIVGVLAPCNCPADLALFASVSSVTAAHGNGEVTEITALLLQSKNALGKLQLPKMINQNSALQATIPSIEADRLLSLTDGAFTILDFFSGLFYLVCILAIVAAFMSRFKERQRDAVVLRLEGFSTAYVNALALIEALFMVLVSTGGILLLYPLFAWGLQQAVASHYGITLALFPAGLDVMFCFAGLVFAAVVAWAILWLRFRRMSVYAVLVREAY